MKKNMLGRFALILSTVLLAVLPGCATDTTSMQGGGSGIAKNRDGSFRLNPKAQHPDDYRQIVGFELSVKVLTIDSLGGVFDIGAFMVGEGDKKAADFAMDYSSGVPSYKGKAKEIVTFSDSNLAGMFFPRAAMADFSDKTAALRYAGSGEALFNDEIVSLTACSIYGKFEVTSVTWIVDSAAAPKAAGEEARFDRVKTVSYPDLPTVANGSKSNYVDIKVPEGEGPFPVILWIHGGGWTALNRKSVLIPTTMEYLMAKGFAVVYTEYTLSVQNPATGVITGGYPQMIYDVKAAVRFIRANAAKYKLDTGFIAAMGESAGGHLSLLLGTTNGNPAYEDFSMGNADYSSEVQAIVSYFGPSDMSPIFAFAVLGSDRFGDAALKKAASPYWQISAATPPLYLTHGRNDQLVPFDNSEKMGVKAKELIGAENVTEVFYDRAAHAEVGVYDSPRAMEAVYTFLAAQLANYRAKTH